MTRVWYAQCKPFAPEKRQNDNEEVKLFQEECLHNNVFGMGWHISEFDVFLGEDKVYINDSLTDLFHSKKSELKKKKNETQGFTRAQNCYKQIDVGDVVLTRFVGVYYFGIVKEKPFIVRGDYRFTWQSKIQDKWQEIGERKDLPDAVRGWISGRKSFGTIIDMDGLAAYTLMKKAGITSEKRTLDSSNFVQALADDDLEDLVCQYMQQENRDYFFLPSSCKKNTPGIEFVMYNPDTNEQIACQTKVSAEINADIYTTDSTYSKYKKIYLFSGKDDYDKRYEEDNLIAVERDQLFHIMRLNSYFRGILDEYFMFDP